MVALFILLDNPYSEHNREKQAKLLYNRGNKANGRRYILLVLRAMYGQLSDVMSAECSVVRHTDAR